jgi:hypothetical protein
MDDNLREKLKAIAEKVLKQANVPNDEKFGSVIAILMMISIILTVIRVLQECNKNKTKDMTTENKYAVYGENIRDFSKKRGWFTRLRIKRLIRKELTKEEYNKYGIKLTEALLDIGEKLKDDEVVTLVEAANV